MSDTPIGKKKVKSRGVPAPGYKVPDSLIKYFEYIPSPQAFYEGYAPSEELPFWWTRDIDLPLTRKQSRRADKKAMAQKNALEAHTKKLDAINLRYKDALEKQAREHERRIQLLDDRTAKKLEELDELAKQARLEHENSFLELELERRKAELEKEFYITETKKIALYDDSLKTSGDESGALAQALAALGERLAQEKKEAAAAKERMTEEYGRLGRTPPRPVVNSGAIIKLNRLESDKIKVERFDPRNILEVKYLTMTDKDTGAAELNNVSFEVRRKGLTVVYSPSERILSNIVSAIMRTLPSNIQINAGEIRIDGAAISEFLREEYREKIKGTVVTLGDMLDRLSRCYTKARKVLKLIGVPEDRLSDALKLFGLSPGVVMTRINRLDAVTRHKIAVCACLALDLPLCLMTEPGEGLPPEDADRLIKLLNSRTTENAVVVLTADSAVSAAVDGSAFYSFDN